jgi:PAS domain S-box-containing protein
MQLDTIITPDKGRKPMQATEYEFEKLKNENCQLRARLRELECAERTHAQTRKTLKKQQSLLFSLLNRLPAFVYLQAPDHSIRFANRYFRQHFGSPKNKKCYEVFRGSSEPCSNCRTFQVFSTKGPQRWEWDCPVDGLSYEVLDYPFIDFDGTLLVLELGLDITERKRMENDLRALQGDLARQVSEQTRQLQQTVSSLMDEVMERRKTEEALRKSEERYALAVAGANDGIWDRDLESGEVYFSPRWKSMLGYADHEISNDVEEWKSRIHRDDYEWVMTALTEYLEGNQPSYEVECRLKAKDGSYRWVRSRGACLRHPNGKAYRIAGSHTDITYRKQMEDALRESESKYRKIFEESRDIIFLFDADARLLDINASACTILGYTIEELQALDIANELYRNEQDRERFLRKLFTDGYVKNMEVEMKRADGELLTVHLCASVIRGAEDAITGYMGTVHDMTEHKNMQQQLLQAQKMESIGLLAGGIAHDFNNMLTAIAGYGETIRENIAGDAVLLSNVEPILHAAERARELTHNLLAVSRKQILNPKPVLINEVISGMNRLISRIIGEDIELTTELCSRQLTVHADRNQLEQVLINLAANARDAMPMGGRLHITAGHVIPGKKTKGIVELDSRGPHALISVMDTGIGIDAKTREKIFEPFFTTKEVGKGTGLGLSISYGIIRQHNGAIIVESEPGKGTRFTIYLPLIGIEVEKQAPRKEAFTMEGTETVLVAEDEEIVKQFLQGILKRVGYRVVTASDGKEAIELFQKHSDSISLVISDVVMPKKNGREIYEEIRALRQDVKFVFISGYTADVILQKGIFNEGVEFITKPFSKNDILRKVREVLDRKEP